MSKKIFPAPFVLTFRFLLFYVTVTVLTLPQFVWILKPYSSCLLFWVLDSCPCFPAISTVPFCVSFPSIAPNLTGMSWGQHPPTEWPAETWGQPHRIWLWFGLHNSKTTNPIQGESSSLISTLKIKQPNECHLDQIMGTQLTCSPPSEQVGVSLLCQLSDQLMLPPPNFSKPSCQFIGKKNPMYDQV